MNKRLSKKLETAFSLAGLENVRVIVSQTASAFESAKKYVGGNGYLLFMSPIIHGRKYGSHFAVLSDNICSKQEAFLILNAAISECLTDLEKKEANVKLNFEAAEDKQVAGVSVELFVKREIKLNFMLNIAVDYILGLKEINQKRGEKNA